MTVDVLCEDDPNFYQACSSVAAFSSSDSGRKTDYVPKSGTNPCGYLCHRNDTGEQGIISTFNMLQNGANAENYIDFACDGEASCLNTDLDEISCEESGKGQCDFVCDSFRCETERSCNGFDYGLWCDGNELYLPPAKICSDDMVCADGTDKAICEVGAEAVATCKSYPKGDLIPLYNYTRCAAIIWRIKIFLDVNTWVRSVCDDFIDQTNCSDYARVGLHCPVGGYMTTVSHQLLCISRSLLTDSTRSIPPLCDDYLDKACVTVSSSCEVHKHQMCDGLLDCEDGSNEMHESCNFMADKACMRRYVYGRHGRRSAVPMAWVHDGTIDCWHGEDESETWPECGFGPTRRFKDKLNSSCEEVFLCDRSNEFIELSRLCDKINSCGNENEICEKSRSLISTFAKAFRRDTDEIGISYCIKGAQNIGFLNNKRCSEHEFIPSKTKIFGNNQSLHIRSPSRLFDCRHFFGESYVFLSCLGQCDSSPQCPLNTSIKFNSCPGQFTSSRVFTIDGSGNLTFLIINPKTGLLGNHIFVCRNTSVCLTYDKVCNLVDDCGDGSDEMSCENHFQCETSREYLHLSQKCDGVFHCLDRSDECNESCGGTIVGPLRLKIMAWIIGILAILLNLIAFTMNLCSLRGCKSEAALLSSGLVIVIHMGDFLGGVYLTVLVSFDAYHGESHCKRQLEWLTSVPCVTLGITSTIGLQISLFSMTALSVIRAIGVKNDIRVPRSISRKSVYKLISLISAMLVMCFVLSFLPMVPVYEDNFVNGVRYENSNTLFLGCQDKKKLMAILEAKYGRMRPMAGVLSWSQIRNLVKAMFSEDYGGIKHKTLSFYGNDPVCVFKYFVRREDPQKSFTVFLLCVNMACFAIITTSYAVIAATSRKSAHALSKNDKNKVNEGVRKTDARLQRVVHAMIISDFLCWIIISVIISAIISVIAYFSTISVLVFTAWHGMWRRLLISTVAC